MHDDTERKNRAILEAIDFIHAQGLTKSDHLKRQAAQAREERDPERRATLIDLLLVEVRGSDDAVREQFERLTEDDALRGWDVRDSGLAGSRGRKSPVFMLRCLTCGYENHLAYEPADNERTDCQNPDLPRHQLKLS